MSNLREEAKPRKRKELKPKKCKACLELFKPVNGFQKVCGPTCALKLVRIQRAKEGKKELKIRKLAAQPYSYHVRNTQAAFNAYIRERDAELPCISCGRYHDGQYHAGHFKTTAARPDLRFNEDNVHKQCSVCNNHLSGNIDKYRPALIAKIGLERVEALEVVPKPHRPSVEELKEIRDMYRYKLKQLKQHKAAA
ncbi:recombination protein NinG [Limnobaculum xujianqingii]|uniref:recombination protein NinG n=1 Tax=Limnobaculum xujianqingii TaxID=2738837 RepID=UPI0011288880|nr:recombination protein NinG [Limnobaculum xujianqingii]